MEPEEHALSDVHVGRELISIPLLEGKTVKDYPGKCNADVALYINESNMVVSCILIQPAQP